MNSYMIGIEIEDSKIKRIMDRIDKAQEEIYECYTQLQKLGVVKIVQKNDKKGAAAD